MIGEEDMQEAFVERKERQAVACFGGRLCNWVAALDLRWTGAVLRPAGTADRSRVPCALPDMIA